MVNGLLDNIGAEFAAIVVGYLIGLFWRRVQAWITHGKYWNFWGPVIFKDFHFIVSSFRIDEFDDLLGVVGGGDAYAMKELSRKLARAGVRESSAVYDSNTLNFDSNLVLIGGSDTNLTTRMILKEMRPCVRIFYPENGSTVEVHDLLALRENPDDDSGKFKAVKAENEDDIGVDYGIIVRSRNPFFPEKAVVVIAGAYGGGSWAGASLAVNDKFLGRCRQLGYSDGRKSVAIIGRFRKYFLPGIHSREFTEIECIFKVLERKDGRPLSEPEIVFVRKISRVPEEL